MSPPAPTGARPDSNALGSPALPAAAAPQPKEPEYLLWPYTGEGSVCFFPPGSVQEHLVTEHGIDSLEVLRKAKGHHDHAREHSRRAGGRLGGAGELLAVGHAHQEAA
jgi:hypothetical protein